MTIDRKKVISAMPYLVFFWIADKLAYTVRVSDNNKFIALFEGITEMFSSPYFSFNPYDMLIGVLGALTVKGAIYLKGKNGKRYRKGIEYGSARWGTAEDIKPYIDEKFSNNILLTQTERLTMNSRPKNPKYARNKSVMIIGGSGSGKTRFFIKPNLMQMHSSYVVTDPKGTVLIEVGKLLERNGYNIKTLNTINFRKSIFKRRTWNGTSFERDTNKDYF